jgi:hypothetical protein
VRPATELAAFLGGFVAAEGTFTGSGDPPTFSFAVQLGETDASMCTQFRDSLGVGSVHHYVRRKAHYDDVAVYAIRRLRDHLAVTIPFMDAHLPPSYKREQYRAWRAKLLDYWEHRAKRVRPCTVEGCDGPRRAYGLCRHHLYEQRGV